MKTMRWAMIGLAAAMLAVCLAAPVGAEQAQSRFDPGTEIVVGFYENTEPLAFVQDGSHYGGVYIEIMEYLSKQAGLKLTPHPITREKNWKELVASGEIDFYIGASNVIVSEDDDLRITAPFLEYANVLVTRNDCAFGSLKTPVVALTHARENWAEYLQNTISTDVQFRYYHTVKDCMMAVIRGDVDASLLNNLEFNYQSKNTRLSSLILWPQYRYPTAVTFAASENVDEAMFSALDSAIAMLTSEYTDAVVDEWLSITYHSYTPADSLYNARHLLAIIVIVLAAVCFYFIMLRRNHRKQELLRQEAYIKEKHQLQILAATSFDYSTIYYIDLDDDVSEPVSQKEGLKETLGITVNPSRSKYTYSLKEFVNNYVKPEYRESILAYLDRKAVLERFKTTTQFIIRYEILPDIRNESFFEMHFVRVAKSSDGHNMMVLAIRCIDDVVKAERVQQQILLDALDGASRANAAKSDFLSRMSHDIRTPMNAILGMTAIAQAHLDDRERVADSLNKISAAGHHLLGLINDVLDMSKIESGKTRLTEENINLLNLIAEMQTILRPYVEEHSHTLEVDTSGIVHARVIGDALRIRQACINLLGNAVKYTPDGGMIRFTIREKTIKHPANCYEFIVQDNGIGMTREVMEHIFDPFMRADDVITKNIQGTGLGLPITQNIARMMNGDIHVDSEPGKGSTFIMTLFLRPQEGQSSDEPEQLQSSDLNVFESIHLAGRRVLLAEDNALNREIAGEILSMAEVTTEEAVNGREAVEKFSASEPGYYDLILMDMQMPIMDGLAATKAIRALDRPDAAAVPIVAMTANAFAEEIQAAKAAGMNEHLAKPIDFALLCRVLVKYLGS